VILEEDILVSNAGVAKLMFLLQITLSFLRY